METILESVGFLIEQNVLVQNDSIIVPRGKFRVRKDSVSKLSDRNILDAHGL